VRNESVERFQYMSLIKMLEEQVLSKKVGKDRIQSAKPASNQVAKI